MTRGSSFETATYALRRRWPVLLFFLVVVPILAFAISATQTKQYRAASSLLFREDALTQSAFGIVTSGAAPQDPARTADTNVQLASLDSTVRRVAARLKVTPNWVASRVDVGPSGQSDIVLVNVTDTDRVRAARVANVYASEFVRQRQEYRRSVIVDARRSVEDELNASKRVYPRSQISDLQRQANRLGVLAALQSGGVQIASNASPPATWSTPATKRNVAVGFVIGLIVGVLTLLAIERLDQRATAVEDVADEFGRPVFGVLPPIPSNRDPLDASEMHDGVQLLRVNLSYAGLERDLKVIAVTSAMPAEGKSTVSSALSSALAQAGHSVLLVECDVRRGTLNERLQAQSRYGLTDVLSGRTTAAEAVVSAKRWGGTGEVSPATEAGVLGFLSAGPRVPNPSDLIEGHAMAEVIQWARSQYEFVVLDTPPALAVPETLALLSHVDGTLIVGRIGVSRRDRIRALGMQLRAVNREPLGLVVFSAAKTSGAYGYGYGEAYASQQAALRPFWGALKA